MPGQYETGHCKRDHHERNQRENAEVRDTSSVIVAFLLLKPSGRANQMIEPGSRCPLLLEKARCVVVRVSHCRPPHVRSGVVSPNSRKSALRCPESDLVIDRGESAFRPLTGDRKSVVSGTSVADVVALGGGRSINK